MTAPAQSSPQTIPVETLFVDACVAKLRQSASKIGVCLEKLTTDQIWSRGAEHENAPGNLVLHLCGNMRQWIISGLGGVPDTRERDKEFETTGGMDGAQLTALLAGTVEEAVQVIASLDAERLTRTYTIQGRTPNGVEAVLQVTEHLGQHTGQIIYATKQLAANDLDLSIPRRR
jgi:hypothetical protein